MTRRIPVALALLLIAATTAFTQPTPSADSAIKDAIATLKKKQVATKSPAEKAKLYAAIKALGAVLSPPKATPMLAAADPAKVTRANYAKIQQRMSISEVEAILGAGKEDEFSGNEKSISWRGAGVTIFATFTDANRPGFATQLIRKSIVEK